MLGRSTRCATHQRMYDEDAQDNASANRLADLSKDPFSPINRIYYNDLPELSIPSPVC
ncbi:hypothetical protein [Telluribacter humicola]|uniref:hypothetical protein n=1 Tax=Telluribacter humicola TaxID=1720261 RepID=UPI001A9630FB|nr:hypothetical protein [Telluribacter humicola]